MLQSPNFAFLQKHEPQLVQLGTLAEQYFANDPVTCLMKLRQFGEVLAQLTAASVGLYSNSEEPQSQLLSRLRYEGFLPGEINQLFHQLRRAGNQATHDLSGDHRTALNHLKAEYPTSLGIADYVLFVGLEAVGVVEAKRQSKDVSGDIDQAKRYSRGYQIKGNETLPAGNPWGEYDIAQVAGMPFDEMVGYLKETNPTQVKAWFQDKKQIAELLDRKDGGRQPVIISHHADRLRRVEVGYGNATKPEDYLDSFQAFLQNNLNQIPALMVVTQRPRELTRQQLKELRMELENAGYGEKTLQVPFPTPNEQKQIATKVKSLFNLIDNIEQQIQQAETDLETLNQSILAKAFRGELVPQDPNDEPASVLLERIQAEKAANTPNKKKRTTRKPKKTEQLDIPGMES